MVMEFFPSPLTHAESEAFFRHLLDHFAEHGFGYWAVEVEGKFAGITGLSSTSLETKLGSHIEIGWRLLPWAWGKGIASTAAREVLQRAHSDFGIKDVYSYTTETNFRSENVMKNIGMTRRHDLDFDHPRTPGWWGQRHIVYHIQL